MAAQVDLQDAMISLLPVHAVLCYSAMKAIPPSTLSDMRSPQNCALGASIMSLRSLSFSGLVFGMLIALVGCTGEDDKTETGDTTDTTDTDTDSGSPSFVDADDDGITPGDGDCDDDDPTVYPGRDEECNGVDDNCNGTVDEGFGDADGDDTADCVDAEECDGVDNDGDGVADEDFADVDGNGVADCVGTEECDGVDNDGDGSIDEGYDADGDGYTQCGTASGGGTSDELTDCDDTDAAINPGAEETSGDEVDNNCDGAVDDGFWSVGDLIISEIMNNPSTVADTYGEWFEVYNASDRDLILNGLKIVSGSSEHSIEPADGSTLTIASGEYMVFGIEDDMAKNGGVGVSYEYDSITLGNESDDLSLVLGGTTIDGVGWDGGGSFPDPDGATLTLDPYYISADLNDDGLYWCEATDPWSASTDMGSPGGTNEVCVTFDHDFDGYAESDGDCDDWDDTIYPGAPEIDPTVDNDCDGEVEWMPIADADYDESKSTQYTCDELYLDGSGSYDQDAGGTIASYSWELTSAPASSATTTADITESDDMSPTFIPDAVGDYTFTLTVNDGGTDSVGDSLTVPVSLRPTNNVPVASAGADQSYADSDACQAISYGAYYDCDACAGASITLSAGGSSDGDGDWMSYSWEVVDYTTGLTVAITDETSETASLSISGVTPTYGETTSTTVTVMVTATDCMGESSTDQMTVTYTCSGT